MALTILGTILILSPLLLIFYFQNKILGFLYIFVGASIFHLLLTLSSQYFHFFRYSIIITINIIVGILIILFLAKNRHKISFKIKINWLTLLVALIIIFELCSVHYFYTGEVNTIYGQRQVVRSFYPYPSFSDDWAGISFTTYSINNNALPTANPLLDGLWDKNFPNIFIGFFAGLAEIFLILKLSPLFGFSIMAIVCGSLICFLVYLFLKSIKVKNIFALAGALCLPWITCSVFLPGIWNLFPFIGGSIFFLISLIALNFKARRLALASGLISLFLYPPFVVIVAPTLLLEFLLSYKLSFKKSLLIIISGFGLVLAVAGFIFILQKANWPNLINFITNNLIRIGSQGPIVERAIWQVIPFGLLPLALIGFISALKKKIFYLIVPLTIGLSYWLLYALLPWFLIIDYARIAVITSYLIMITIGLGAAAAFNWLKNKYEFLKEKNNYFALEIIILAVFIALSFFYTRRTNWLNIKLVQKTASGLYEVTNYAPINNYLNQDDLALFAGIYQKRFLTSSWKGLVIGAATNNYPLDSKAGIITNHLMKYSFFMRENCDDKNSQARLYNLSYVYSDPFNCPNFIELGHSREDLYLYKFQP